jgi:hypothetical protein
MIPGAPAGNKGPTWPTSEYDNLLVDANGRRVGEVDNVELYRLLAALKVPGFEHSKGRQANLEAFAVAYQKVYDADGRNGVVKWLGGA